MAQETSPALRGAIIAGVVASVALVACVWSTPLLLTSDGPQHLFGAWLRNHFDDPGSAFPRYLAPADPVTSRGFSALFCLFEVFMPWRAAHQATVAAVALAFAWGYLALVAALDPRRAPLGLLGFAAALQWSLYMGFFSYVLSTGAAFLTLAFALHRPAWGARDRVLLAALLFAQASAHTLPAELTCVALGLLVLARHRGRALARELALLAACSVGVVYVAARALGAQRVLLSLPGGPTRPDWPDWGRRVALLGRAFVSGPAWRAWPLVALALAAMAALAARVRRGEATRDEAALGAAGAVFFACALLAPLHVPGWQFVSTRFTPLAVLLLVATLPWHALTDRRARAAASAALGVFVAASLGWSWTFHRALGRRAADALSGLDAPIRRTGPRLPVIISSAGVTTLDGWGGEVPFDNPWVNLGQLYAVAQGGLPAYSFIVAPQIHDFVYRADTPYVFPPQPDRGYVPSLHDAHTPQSRDPFLTRVGWFGSSYEDVIVLSPPGDHAAFLRRGYVADYERGELMIARFEGCPTRLVLEGAAPGPARVEMGWVPLRDVAWRATVTARETAVPRAPCGPVWFRVRDAAGRRCQPEPGQRMFGAMLRRGVSNTVTCTLAP